MAKLDTVSFKGRSGREYSFRLYSWEHSFKALPAVYVVANREVKPDGPPTLAPVYVGVTEDLSKIFESHEKSDCFQMYYANTLAVLAEPDMEQRHRIEQDLLEALAPPCNGEEPI